MLVKLIYKHGGIAYEELPEIQPHDLEVRTYTQSPNGELREFRYFKHIDLISVGSNLVKVVKEI